MWKKVTINYKMRHFTTIFILILGLSNFANGQVFPDSLKDSWIAQLKKKDILTIYISRQNCFSAGFEKFQLTKKNKTYRLTAFIPISAYELKLKRFQLNSILPDTLPFKLLNTYILTDTNVIAFAQIEIIGQKCGQQTIKSGAGTAIGNYKMILKGQAKKFSNNCFIKQDKSLTIIWNERMWVIQDIEEFAFPEKYYTDWDEQE